MTIIETAFSARPWLSRLWQTSHCPVEPQDMIAGHVAMTSREKLRQIVPEKRI
jgi:hypothetical protein